MVPILSIVFMVISMLLGIIVPIGLLAYLQRKYHTTGVCFWIGCAVMFIFAMVLEQIVHGVVLGSAVGAKIQGNIWLYAAYGSVMAGLFEESGRFLAMRFFLKKHNGNRYNALMYGAGHGGFEMAMILSMGMVNNLIYSVMINAGKTESLLAPLDEATRATVQSVFDALIETPSYQFVLSPVERIAALIAQISFSVIVWYAATGEKCRYLLLLLAFALHVVLDAAAVLAAGAGIPLLAVEAIVWLLALGIAFIARVVWKKA